MHAPPSASSVPRWRTVAAGALALVLTGCPINIGPDPDPIPPQDDGQQIERDSACTLRGSLELALVESEGVDAFKPLAPGQGPVVHYGPQGGTHLELGVRVANPATAFPGLQVRFLVESQTCDMSGCLSFGKLGEFRTVMRNPERFLPQEDGATVLSGFLVLVYDWPQNAPRRITVEATDRCGRSGTTVWEVAAGTR